MFADVAPITANAEPYATVDELLVVDDLLEQDVSIVRWHRNGKPLKLRLKALNLEQQDQIHQASLVKNAKTGEWEQHRPTFCAETLVRLLKAPSIDIGQARALVKKNPVIIEALVNFGWALASLTSEEMETAAHALAPPDPTTAPAADAGDGAGAE